MANKTPEGIQPQFEATQDAAKLTARIKEWAKKGKEYRQETHEIAISCLLQSGEGKNNITPARDMLEACPDMLRKNALIKWFTTFGRFSFKDGELQFSGGKKLDEYKARVNPFWTFKEQEGVEFKEFDLEAFSRMVNTAVKRLQQNEENGVQSDPVIIAAVRDLVAVTARAAKVAREEPKAAEPVDPLAAA